MVQLDEAVGCWWYLGVRQSYRLNPYKLYVHKQEMYIYAPAVTWDWYRFLDISTLFKLL